MKLLYLLLILILFKIPSIGQFENSYIESDIHALQEKFVYLYTGEVITTKQLGFVRGQKG
jgi:hypothetical protein